MSRSAYEIRITDYDGDTYRVFHCQDGWHWEPTSYTGSSPWSTAYPFAIDAIKAALYDVPGQEG